MFVERAVGPPALCCCQDTGARQSVQTVGTHLTLRQVQEELPDRAVALERELLSRGVLLLTSVDHLIGCKCVQLFFCGSFTFDKFNLIFFRPVDETERL